MKIVIQNKIYSLPDFLIVGAAKSGTTSLYNYLKQSSDIFMCEPKEPWFFSYYNEINPTFNSPQTLGGVYTSLEDYSELFPETNYKIKGDASPSYLNLYKKTIENIKYIYGEDYLELKIIIILRDPAQRVWSMYNHFKRSFDEPLKFYEAINKEQIQSRIKNNWNPFYDYIGVSQYYNQVKAYMNTFPQVKVVLFDELVEDPQSVVGELCDFLNVKKHNFKLSTSNKGSSFNENMKIFKPFYRWYINHDNFVRKFVRKVVGYELRSKIDSVLKNPFLSRKERLDDFTRKYLLDNYFREDIEKLSELLPDKRDKLEKWLN